VPLDGSHRRRRYVGGRDGVRVAPLTPAIGAVVEQLDLRTPLSRSQVASIGQALRDHKVLFFRGQSLSAPELVAFGRAFGALHCRQPTALPGHGDGESPSAHPEIHTFDYGESRRGRENFWHFDVLPEGPAPAAILSARIVPEVGGDTLFSDLASVYDSLSDRQKERLEHAVGVYDFVFERRLARFRGKDEAEVMAMSMQPLQELPLVAHRPPPDGRTVLLLNPGFLVHIKDMTRKESRDLTDAVLTRINRPEFQCRFRWEAGDIAFWDNASCVHYATNNYFPERRVMDRLTFSRMNAAESI
jgi:taurine dioxygenase